MLQKKWFVPAVIFTIGLALGFLLSHLSASSQQRTEVTSITVEDFIEVPGYPDDLSFAGEKIPLDIFYTRESLERELIVNTYWHSSTLMLLKRTNRWFPVIEPILKKNGVPDDFKYLCLIESNLLQAKSPAGAIGFWQILEVTAKELGLEVTEDVDQRYDVELSTEAACNYFLKAYLKYGNWSLVAASYNAGQKKISDLLAAQRVSSYHDLLMPEETERYLFRILSMKLIVEDPKKYGFKLDEEDYYAPLAAAEVSVSGSVSSWTDFANQHGITYKLLKYFNPWLRTEKLKNQNGKTYKIKIPEAPFNKTFAGNE
ncbi:MAG: lytic transglycosylase domain-containing protein [Bacteroidales bacterium]|nr:lytic transglycosylase domain-containing protein [Bacteroidales bacterium]